MTISERLFKALYDRRISQKEFSERTGINTRTVSAWQTRGSDPPARLIPKIAAFLGVSVIWLLTGEEYEEHAPIVNNGSVVGNVGTNNGVVAANYDGHVLSENAAELMRLCGTLTLRDQIKVLDLAYRLADEASSK